jgi:uncharacterized protein
MGAVQRVDGDYALRCLPLQAPQWDSIPSKKRAEARRRHDLLCEVVALVLDGMARPRLTALVPASGPGHAGAAAGAVLAAA